MNDARIWFTSDLHLNHDREFICSPRGFKSVYEMNDYIINMWNSTVDAEDHIYVLGDLMLGDSEAGIKLIKQLKGNIHVVRGNHDSDERMKLYNECYNIVEVTEGQFLHYGKFHFYLSHYPCLTANYDDGKLLKAKTISICGHRHTQDRFCDMPIGLCYHVELDAHDNHLVPADFIIEDIANFIEQKKG